MRHMACRVVTRSGTARPRVQRLEVGNGGVTSGIRASGPRVDSNQDGTSRQAAGVSRRVTAAGQSFPERTKGPLQPRAIVTPGLIIVTMESRCESGSSSKIVTKQKLRVPRRDDLTETNFNTLCRIFPANPRIRGRCECRREDFGRRFCMVRLSFKAQIYAFFKIHENISYLYYTLISKQLYDFINSRKRQL